MEWEGAPELLAVHPPGPSRAYSWESVGGQGSFVSLGFTAKGINLDLPSNRVPIQNQGGT